MRILHYSLGFPPYRSGGLTKFCMDLMHQQCCDGHTVALLWPGHICAFPKKVVIKARKNVLYDGKEMGNFEVINPLPISYDEGISDIGAFTKVV